MATTDDDLRIKYPINQKIARALLRSEVLVSRIRTIKPEFWTNEKVVECSTNARLLFIGLWNFCDDDGNHPAAEKTCKANVFPCDDFTVQDIRRMLTELEVNGLIEFYVNENKRFFNVIGWEHQKIDRRQKPRYPTKFDERSTIIHRGLDEHSLLYHRSQTTDLDHRPQKERKKQTKKEKSLTPFDILKTTLTEKTAKDVIKHRNALKKPLTARAAESLLNAFEAYGDPEDAAAIMIERGWVGFNSEWVQPNNPRAGPLNVHRGPITAFSRPTIGEEIAFFQQSAAEHDATVARLKAEIEADKQKSLELDNGKTRPNIR